MLPFAGTDASARDSINRGIASDSDSDHMKASLKMPFEGNAGMAVPNPWQRKTSVVEKLDVK